VDLRYLEFCRADPLFYDQTGACAAPSAEFRAAAPTPDGWTERVDGTWRGLRRDGLTLPHQGWKIHVSATLENAARVLGTVHEYCRSRTRSYKHLLSAAVLLRANAKDADRARSGKFITIYPADERALRTILTELDQALAGERGPYILSDLRCCAGPLFVRYGGFSPRFTEVDGVRVPAIQAPGGSLVPDRREPRFVLPDWVDVPDFLLPHLRARGADTGLSAYQVTEALHFSNGGGVYRATRRCDGRPVVLKEARPHAGWPLTAPTRCTGWTTSTTRCAGSTACPAYRPSSSGSPCGSTSSWPCGRCRGSPFPAGWSGTTRCCTHTPANATLPTTPRGRARCTSASPARSPRCTIAA
jgi:hypothetical protein